jgi:hypothetical protein
MKQLLRWIPAILAGPLLLAGQARADFSYSTAVVPTSAPFGAGSTVSFTSVTKSGLNGSQGISIAEVSVASTTAPPATDTTTPPGIAVQDTITISQTTPTVGTGTLVINGFINFTRSDTGGQLSSFVFNPAAASNKLSVLIGGNTYTIDPATLAYSQPTVNDPNTGGISIDLNVVPEPSSLALIGVGGLVLAAPRLRRIVRRIARQQG